MFVDFNYIPSLEDFDKNNQFKLESVVKLYENAAHNHSNIAGFNVIEGSMNGKTWIITDWLVEIDNFPVSGDEVKAVTWSLGATSVFGFSRDFELYKNNEICGRGTSRWVLIDTNTGRPVKVSEEIANRYENETKTVYDVKLPKIEIPENFSNVVEIEPRRNDIDYNEHVHNLVYIDYAMEALPLDVYKNCKFKNIRITYKTAVKAGQKIVAKYALVNDKHNVCIYTEDNTLCTLISFY